MTIDQLSKHFYECGLGLIAPDGLSEMTPIIRTDTGDFWIAAVWKNDQNQLIIDMGQRVKR